jgi:glutaconyl-CoA/methylmalonyl-CoA decarboxylase subunit delta
MNQPVTTNPMIIMMINMTVVFAVLWGLSLIVRFIYVVDPTRKHKFAEDASVQKKTTDAIETETPITEMAATVSDTEEETLVLIAAALAAYGYGNAHIVSIRPVRNPGWTQAARMESVQNNFHMF